MSTPSPGPGRGRDPDPDPPMPPPRREPPQDGRRGGGPAPAARRRWCVAAALAALAGPAMGDGSGTDAAPAPVRSLVEIRQHHVVLQQWELSCAAAALATVLRHQHNVPVTERSVALGLIDREEYLANPDLVRLRQGFSLLDLKRYVDGMGYDGVGLGRLTLPDLRERAPIIVPVNLQGFPHFVVFRGATADTVLLADPAFGNVTMAVDKFLDGWIEYQDVGRVGFLVTEAEMPAPPGRLAAWPRDFVVLR
ncbi:MAG: C39 family peptidase [Gammaproteobacteria bacterium]|nr:C39 family peptidase [Gammaproteobacteria bacterium]